MSWLRIRRRSPDEAGASFVIVLTAIAVFSVIVASLIAAMSTNQRLRSAATRAGASIRAVDGALDAAINQLRRNPSLGQPEGFCHPVGRATDPVPYSLEIDGVAVVIDCLPLDLPDAVDPLPAGGGPALTVLGGYTGPLDDLAASRLATDLGGWIADAGNQLREQLAPRAPGFVGLGPQSLRVVGDVMVTQWSIGQRAGLVGPGPSPWLDVEGAYRQGGNGPFGGLGIWLLGTYVPLTPPCGVLDPAFPLGPDLGLRIRTTTAMTCGSPITTPAPPDPPKLWDVAAMETAAQQLPEVCDPRNGVVTIPPGFYNWRNSAILNRWFGIGQCDGVTFFFPPGDYFFDVAGGDPNARSALKFDDHTSNWVFGSPRGWDPSRGRAPDELFPLACDPKRAGTSITLSGRTTLRHQLGLVAMCGARDPLSGAARPLVFQMPLPSNIRWAAVPAPGGASSDPTEAGPAFGDPEAATRSASLSPEEGVSFPPYGGTYDTSEGSTPRSATAVCALESTSCNPVLTLRGFTAPTSPAYGGELGQARLMIRGAPNSHVASPNEFWWCPGEGVPDCTAMAVRIDFVRGGSCLLYQSDVPRGLYAFDLMPCRGQGLVDATQLDGATVTLIPQLRRRNCGWPLAPCGAMAFSVEYVWLDVTINQPIAPSSMSTWVDPGGSRDAGLRRGIHFFGPVYVPRTQVEVNWWGSAPTQPIFAGGLTARALASWPETGSVQIGLLASHSVEPPRRRVLIRARVGERLRGTAVVTIEDRSEGDVPSYDPGRLVSVEDWRQCNEVWDPTRAQPCTLR